MRWASLLSQKSLWLFGPVKPFYVYSVRIQDQSFNNFENGKMKLSVDEAKLTGLWAKNFATIQLVLISKFAFRPEKLSGLSRNGPLACFTAWLRSCLVFSFIHLFCINKKYNNSIQKYTKDNTIFQLNYYKIKCGKGKEAYIEAGGL